MAFAAADHARAGDRRSRSLRRSGREHNEARRGRRGGLVIPGSGHFVAEEAPKEMLAALTAFLTPYRDRPAAAHNPKAGRPRMSSSHRWESDPLRWRSRHRRRGLQRCAQVDWTTRCRSTAGPWWPPGRRRAPDAGRSRRGGPTGWETGGYMRLLGSCSSQARSADESSGLDVSEAKGREGEEWTHHTRT
jgi:hypothetical protein